VHSTLYGTPTPTQVKLYENYPKYRGYSSRELDVEKFEAAFILALAQTLGGESKVQSFLFFPAEMQPLLTETIKNTVWGMVKRFKTDRKLLAAIQDALNHVYMGPYSQLSESPTRWAAFGLHRDDVLPSWIQNALLKE
jgi:hypothetical protein